MTQENNPQVDMITQAQEQMDGQQGLTVEAVPQYATLEQIREIVAQQMAPIKNQVSGLHSGWAKGLNSIREQTTAAAREEIQRVTQEAQQRQDILGHLPEDDRERLAPVVNAILDRQPSQTIATPQQAPQANAGASDEVIDQWNQVREAVKTFRLNPDSSEVMGKYRILLDPNVAEAERWPKFVDELVLLRGAANNTPVAAPTNPTVPNSSPPVNAAPPGTSREYRNIDDVYDAFRLGAYGEQSSNEAQQKYFADLKRFGQVGGTP
jgi:hypothetical protein